MKHYFDLSSLILFSAVTIVRTYAGLRAGIKLMARPSKLTAALFCSSWLIKVIKDPTPAHVDRVLQTIQLLNLDTARTTVILAVRK